MMASAGRWFREARGDVSFETVKGDRCELRGREAEGPREVVVERYDGVGVANRGEANRVASRGDEG